MIKQTRNIVFILLYLLVSCKKDTTQVNSAPQVVTKFNNLEGCNYSDTCPVNFRECTSPIGYLTTIKSPWIEDPVFNPNNGNEIVFYKREVLDNKDFVALVVLNIVTGETKTLTTKVNIVTAETYWSKDGNIYYNGDDQKIYKYSTSENTSMAVEFLRNDICPRIIDDNIYSLNGTVTWPFIYYRSDKNGNRIDSMYAPGDYASDLSYDKKFAYADTSYYGYDISVLSYSNNVWNKQKVATFNDVQQNLFVMDINWHPNNEDLFLMKPGELYKVNIKTKKLSLVKLACNVGRMMNNFAISPDGKKIVIAYQVPRQLDPNVPCKVTFYSYLGIMDINGCNERVLYTPDYAP